MAPQRVQRHPEITTSGIQNTMAAKDPKSMTEDQSTEEEGELHRVVNPNEAAILVHSLDEALILLEAQISTGEERNVMEDTVIKFKEAISRVIPNMAEADVKKVIGAISNPTCLVLRPKTDAREELLEVMMPLEDAPGGDEVAASIQGDTPLNRNQRELLRELFEDLEVAHDHTARACSVLACLSISLMAPQLMATLKAVTRPLIQVNALEGLMDKVKTPRKAELPDDMGARVQLTMTPNPKVEGLQKEKDNSPTRMLAATLAYKILCQFGKGTTQREMQAKYAIKAKQLAACLTGRKYLGSTDRKVSRKCKASGKEASTSQ